MKVNYKLSLICSLAIALIIITSAPFSFGDSTVTLIQNNVGSGQSQTQAQCVFLSNVVQGNSLLVTLDAVNINNPVTSIVDTQGNSWVSKKFTMNSASTWVQSWEAENIANGGSDTVTITYTSASNGSNAVTCDEYLGNVNFTAVATLGSGGALLNCASCILNLTATTHKINVIHGYADSSQTPPQGGIAYSHLGGITPRSGSGTSQAIAGSSNSILIYHAETDIPVSVVADSAMVVTCSPACNQSPMFVHAFYADCLGVCSTVTSTITGWLFPNFANGVNSFSWFIGFLILLVPLSMVDTVFMSGNLSVDRNVIIFINLAMLFLGALLATMVNQLPFAIPFVFGMFLVVYIWRGRG